MKPIQTLMELRNKAATNPDYARLTRLASENLGGPASDAPLDEHHRWLEVCAMDESMHIVIP